MALFKKKAVADNAPDVNETADEEQEAGGKGKQRRKSKNAKKGGVLRRIFRIFVLLLAVGVGVVGYFIIRHDQWSLRSRAIDQLNLIDPQTYTYKQRLEAELETLNDRELALNERAAKIASDEQRLDRRKTELDKRESDLNVRDATPRAPIYRQPLSDQQLADMKSIGKTYENMDPTDAARIMATLYNAEDMAAIVYYMSERGAAAVLTEMDVRLAARITDLLLKE